MWKKMVGRARRMLQKPLEALVPHRFISSLDAEQFGWYNWKKRELLTGFTIGETDTVVDVGCGEGSSSDFAAQCGATVYAVDIDAEAIAGVERRMKGRKLRHPFHTVVSDANPLPLDDGVATHVLAQEVMEHVDDPRQFLAELVRIGRPGARYLLSVPDPASESLQKELAPEIYWRKPNHLRIFARDEFDRVVRDAGLEIEKRTHYSFFWSMWWVLFWSDKGGFAFGSPGTPVLSHWNKTWVALMKTPNGARIKQALDDFMPKSQIILARKAA